MLKQNLYINVMVKLFYSHSNQEEGEVHGKVFQRLGLLGIDLINYLDVFRS